MKSKRIFTFIIFVSILITITGCQGQRYSDVTVTYIASDGYLIQSADKKVLIDAIFNIEGDEQYYYGPSDSTLEKMEQALPPFDDIDIVFVTHRHFDHFDPVSAARHLESNRDAILVGPSQVFEMLRDSCSNFELISERVIALAPEKDLWVEIVISDISIRALGLAHGSYMITDEETGEQYDKHAHTQNLGYLFTINGNNIMHIGDARLKNHESCFQKLRDEGVKTDILFIGFYDISAESQNVFFNIIEPEEIVFMHFTPDAKVQEQYINIFKEHMPDAHILLEPFDSFQYKRQE
ncbi:MAG: MBL fold metallo-hydrolase [candidate division Zixibacteria bacterium]